MALLPPTMVSELQSDDELAVLRVVNAEKASVLSPAIAYTVVLMVIGTLGNPVAIYIYGFKWQNTTTRVFLLCLAVLDLLNCVITMPTEICLMADFYYFPNGNFCMISRFVTYFINNATSAVFLFIASDRYFRICRPHGWKFSVMTAKLACAVSLCIGAVVSWPAIVLYGNKTVTLPLFGRGIGAAGLWGNASVGLTLNVTGIMCNVKNGYENTMGPDLFFNYLWCGFIVCVFILSIFYILIGRVILRRMRAKARAPAVHAESSSSSGGRPRKCNGFIDKTCHTHLQSSPPLPNIELVEGAENADKSHLLLLRKSDAEEIQEIRIAPSTPRGANLSASPSYAVGDLNTNEQTVCLPDIPLSTLSNGRHAEALDPSTYNESPCAGLVQVINFDPALQGTGSDPPVNIDPGSHLIADPNVQLRGSWHCKNCVPVNGWRTRVPRSTLMLFAITAVFILTFLPFLIIISIRQRVGPSFYTSLTTCQEILVHIFSRSYLVNNCANPIVYGLVNEQFRTEVKLALELTSIVVLVETGEITVTSQIIMYGMKTYDEIRHLDSLIRGWVDGLTQ
ncbi:hypothetical protein Btru_073547 [Bulinus truncatus]|nr:hypothetical protein Btru_073547 [Bulinus truncatus]